MERCGAGAFLRHYPVVDSRIIFVYTEKKTWPTTGKGEIK